MELVAETDLGARVRELRESAGLSQTDLGEQIGLSQSAVSKVETGERALSARELAAIATALRVSVARLVEAQPTTSVFLRAGDADAAGTKASLDTFRECVNEYFGLRSLAG